MKSRARRSCARSASSSGVTTTTVDVRRGHDRRMEREPTGPSERAGTSTVDGHRHLEHPAVTEHTRERAADVQLRIADAITAFAGSMPFVYIHAVGFAVWMLVVESDPWPRLTLIVSLEAIFLSTFVMIGQNRQAEFQ